MKTIEQIQDEIRSFDLGHPGQVTPHDLLRVVNLLGNVVDHIEEMYHVVGPIDDHPEADCQNEI